jgi:predicted GTPase
MHGAQAVDPRPYAVGSIRDTFARYGTTGPVLPAMGYSSEQIGELEETMARTPCDVILIATPVDLRRLQRISRPAQRVQYELREVGSPALRDILKEKFGRAAPLRPREEMATV